MRLGQLSRKININSSLILDYLENELGVHVNASLNAKIEDEYVNKVMEHFSITNQKDDLVIANEKNLEEKESISVNTTTQETPSEEASDSIEENTEEQIEEEVEMTVQEEQENQDVEIIKAKAEKLEGLKVIGKIDLPPPPPPEMIEIDGVMYDKAELKKQRYEERERKKAEAIKRREEKKKQEELKRLAEQDAQDAISQKAALKANISFAEQRKKEEAALARKKKQEERRKREKQRKHYEEKHLVVKEKLPKKKAVKKEKVAIETSKEVSAPEPKNAFAKFWRWLTTY